jgi:heme A synthase
MSPSMGVRGAAGNDDSILPPRHPDDLSGHAHRQLIGYAGLALPIFLLIVAAARPTPGLPAWPPLDSISAYYYSGAVAIFTGLLVALALLLLTYRGYGNEYGVADRWIARIGGIAAFCVAFFPTKPPDGVPEPAWWEPSTNVVHYVSATTLFLAFIVFSIWLFRKTGRGGTPDDEKRNRNRIYLVCGVVMIASVLWAGSSIVTGAPIFVPESIALLAFAFSWLTKGRAGRTVKRAVRAAVKG